MKGRNKNIEELSYATQNIYDFLNDNEDIVIQSNELLAYYINPTRLLEGQCELDEFEFAELVEEEFNAINYVTNSLKELYDYEIDDGIECDESGIYCLDAEQAKDMCMITCSSYRKLIIDELKKSGHYEE